MPTALPVRALHTLRGLTETFLARDAAARFDWRLALGSAAGVGIPLIVGLATGQTRPAVVVAVAALLTLLETPRKTPRDRAGQLLRRVALLASATVLGILVAGHLAATLLAAAVLGLAVPLPGFGIIPLIMMITASHPQPGISGTEYLLLFLTGGLWAAALLMVPFTSGRYEAQPPRPRVVRPPLPERARRSWTTLLRAAAEGDPKFRYAIRVCTCFTLACTAVTLLDVPHSNWVLTGILTTLRPTWGETRSRIVKRLGGMVIGCVLTGVLLVLTPQAPVAEALAVMVCAAIARPVRGINYGFWPVFATPMLLLLADFDSRLGWVDVAERLANNICGALLAAATMLFLWPSHEQARIPAGLQLLLDTHARFIDRVATVIEFGPPLEREHNILKAEAAATELAAGRNRLAQRPTTPPELLTALDDTLDAAGELRDLITVHQPYEAADEALDPQQLRLLAAHLRRTAATATGTPVPEPTAPPAVANHPHARTLTDTAEALTRHALHAAQLSHPKAGARPRQERTPPRPDRSPGAGAG
ncbi:FUSC family protein [Streptomyces sp. NPDC058401]|uniref:FUSC family protein n=1 Tax=Streptomyces sp. NPDC058401 TaxID=3346480 RepID=UPI0036636BCB